MKYIKKKSQEKNLEKNFGKKVPIFWSPRKK